MSLSLAARGSSAARTSAFRPATNLFRVCVRPFTCSVVAPGSRSVKVGFFNFGKQAGADPNTYNKANKRESYIYEDVDDYFNYMGFLAEEGNYDRMEAMLKVLEPVDAILLLAASQNDTPKIIELIQNGANLEIKGLDGKTAAELATKPETQEILRKGKVAA